MRIFPVVAAAVVLVAGAAGCSSSKDKASSTTTPTPTPEVTTSAPAATSGGAVKEVRALAGNRWSVGTLTLKAGDSVKVIDADSNLPHNFVVDGVGRSETLRNGDTFTLRFPTAGTFEFVCTFHESLGMTGTITVT